MRIEKSTLQDLEDIFKLYKLATAYQKTKFSGNIWPEFERTLVETEIMESRQFKITINDQVVCVWAITFDDPIIWKDKNKDAAMYIHRIATNPEFRGHDFVKTIVNWAERFAKKKNLQYIRLDTCGDNKRLIDHYVKCGFTFLGISKLTNAKGLPSHYDLADVCYFEIDTRI